MHYMYTKEKKVYINPDIQITSHNTFNIRHTILLKKYF